MTPILKLGQTFQTNYLPMAIYLYKVKGNNGNTRTRCEVCSCSSDFAVTIEQINGVRLGILKPLLNVSV